MLKFITRMIGQITETEADRAFAEWQERCNASMLEDVQKRWIRVTDFASTPQEILWDTPVFKGGDEHGVAFEIRFADRTGWLVYEFDADLNIRKISGRGVATRDFENDITAHYGPQTEKRVINIILPARVVAPSHAASLRADGWAYFYKDENAGAAVFTRTIGTPEAAQAVAEQVRQALNGQDVVLRANVVSVDAADTPPFTQATWAQTVNFETARPLIALGFTPSPVENDPEEAPTLGG